MNLSELFSLSNSKNNVLIEGITFLTKHSFDKEVENPPELYLSNDSAGKIIELIGYNFDYAGKILLAEIPKVKQKIIKLLNTTAEIDSEVTEPQTTQKTYHKDGKIEVGPEMRTQGFNADYFRQRLEDLFKVLEYAQENELDVTWG